MKYLFRFFSLTEVLVSLFILSSLLTCLSAPLARVFDKARTVQCVSNLQTFGLAFHQYAMNYSGVLPHEDRGSGHEFPEGSCWADVLLEYVPDKAQGLKEGTEGVRHGCETLPFEDPLGNESVYNPASYFFSYKMNSRLEDFEGSPYFRRVSSVALPHRTVLLFDSRIDTRYYQYRSYGIFSSVYERHGSGAGFLFVDGHVDIQSEVPRRGVGWFSEGGLEWTPE